MARIKIEDLPKDMKISKEEMKKVVGGALITNTGIEGGLKLSLTQTSPRQTTDTILRSANIAAPFVPGGAVVSAAISGVAQLKNGNGLSGAGSG